MLKCFLSHWKDHFRQEPRKYIGCKDIQFYWREEMKDIMAEEL